MAVDGSNIILPKEKDIIQEFGSIKIKNQFNNVYYDYPVSKAFVIYDVLNNICIDSIMGNSRAYEVTLALEHLDTIEKKNLRLDNELLIFDRGYPSYHLFASLISKGYHFVARCSRGSFKDAQYMFKNTLESRVVTLKPSKNVAADVRRLGLPFQIQIRFIRVVLNTGEVEVLATSLLDKTQYPSAIFKEIYHLRWEVETFYDIVKNRLNLENFSGETVEAVKQDFFATILITGLEATLIVDAQEELDSRTPFNRQSLNVNKAVSFNTIKNHVFELFFQENDLDLLLDKLTKLFLTHPISVQKDRNRPRNENSWRRVINFFKRKKKIVF